MNIEAATKEILALLLAEGREFDRMDPVLARRFAATIVILLDIADMADLKEFGRFDLKFFDGHFQVRIDGEKRLWLEIHEGEILITYFGSTDHRHGKKR